MDQAASPAALEAAHRPDATKMTRHSGGDGLKKLGAIGEKIATIFLPALVSLGTMVWGLWLTNAKQDMRIETLDHSATQKFAAFDKKLDEVDSSIDEMGARFDKRFDDAREDIRDLRAEISAIRGARGAGP